MQLGTPSARRDLGASWINTQSIGNKRTAIQIVGVEGLQIGHIGSGQLLDNLFGNLGITLKQQLASFRIGDIFGQSTTQQIFGRYCWDIRMLSGRWKPWLLIRIIPTLFTFQPKKVTS